MAKRKFGLGAQAAALWNAAPVLPPESDDAEIVAVQNLSENAETAKSEPNPAENAEKNEGGSSTDFSIVPESETEKSDCAIHANPEKTLLDGLSLGRDGQLFVEIERLRANPEQPRIEFDEAGLEDLASSMKELGVLQAITIEDAGDGTFFIIAGERRTKAAKIAGLSKIPAQIRSFSEQKKLEVALIENIQRLDLNIVEEARAYQRLIQVYNLSQEQIGVRVGKNRATVSNALRILKLPEEMQNALISGKITSGHARALLSVKDAHDQKLLFSKIIDLDLTVRKAEKLALELNEGSRRKAVVPAAKDPNLTAVEQKFIETFGTKVSINGSLEKGTVEISYFSKEDLDRLYGIVVREN